MWLQLNHEKMRLHKPTVETIETQFFKLQEDCVSGAALLVTEKLEHSKVSKIDRDSPIRVILINDI